MPAATVRLVEENAAGGKVREVFDDIKRTKNIDFVPNFWRALASYPDQLELVWRQLKTLMHPEAAGRKSQLDAKTREMLGKMNDPATNLCVTAERELVRMLEGDCHSPIGA